MKLDLASWKEVQKHLEEPHGIIISTGSTEQHGPIGLIGTDTICSSVIAEKVAERSKMYVAPPIGYTPAEFNMKFPGTVSISVDLFVNLVDEVISSLLKHGFKFVYILNGHGANIDPIKKLLDKFNHALFFKSWWDFPEVNDIRITEFGDWEGMHATPSEISITQINHRIIDDIDLNNLAQKPPEKLSLDYIKNHSGDKHGPPNEHFTLFPDGRVGSHSALANPEIGKKLFDAAVNGVFNDIKKINSNLL